MPLFLFRPEWLTLIAVFAGYTNDAAAGSGATSRHAVLHRSPSQACPAAPCLASPGQDMPRLGDGILAGAGAHRYFRSLVSHGFPPPPSAPKI